MGMFKKSSCSGITTPPNPDPNNFRIEEVIEKGEYCVALIHYPNCTTYNGYKLLVYKCKQSELLDMKFIDPHFLENKRSPVARFAANNEGKNYALTFVDSVQKT